MNRENNSLVRNDLFDGSIGLERGRSRLTEVLWYLAKVVFFLSALPWPSGLKRRILVLFGAKIGKGFYIRPRVNIHFPWKLQIGDYCWIGENCEILNLEKFEMEDHSALAHQVYIATGNHDITSKTMRYKNRPIKIGGGSWIGTRAFIGPGVVVGRYAVIAAGSVVVKEVGDFEIVGGNPAKRIGTREITGP